MNAGDHHYRAYVGPPKQFDFMGATQFRLLTTLGLRSKHRVLDVGCGSLRLGKLLIPYLDAGNYFGIEPNKWLIKDAVRNELGRQFIKLKKIKISYKDDFNLSVFGNNFDYVILQSIFSHCGKDLIKKTLDSCKHVVEENGIVLATFIEGEKNFLGEGWVYPECVEYHPQLIREMIQNVGFECTSIPWFHPRQTWYLISNKENVGLVRENKDLLRGVIFFSSEFPFSLNSSFGHQ